MMERRMRLWAGVSGCVDLWNVMDTASRGASRLPVVSRVERQLNRQQHENLRGAPAQMASVIDGIAELQPAAHGLGRNCREVGAHSLSGPAEKCGQRKGVVQRAGYIILIEQGSIAVVLGTLGAGGQRGRECQAISERQLQIRREGRG